MYIFAGLGYWSEQAFEAIHADFKSEWEKVKVGLDHKDYINVLKEAIIRYNAKHV